MQRLEILNNENKVNILGRYFVKDNSLYFDNVASGIEFSFYGDFFTISAKTIPHKRINQNYPMYTIISVMIDNTDPLKLPFDIKNEEIKDFSFNVSLGYHHVVIMKADDPLISTFVLENVSANFIQNKAKRKLNIEAFGDSISTGGDNLIIAGPSLDVVPGTGMGSATYATYLSFKLNANISVLARCGLCLYGASSSDQEVVISKIYDKCSTQNLVDWDMNKYTPDLVLINLGTNDELGDLYTPSNFTSALVQFVSDIHKIYKNKPNYIFIAGQMNKNNDLIEAINASSLILKERDINSYVVLANKARRGHPNVFEHQELADKLYELTKKIGY